jgi:hypothetical protein
MRSSRCKSGDREPFQVLRARGAPNARINTFILDIIGYADDENPAMALAALAGAAGRASACDRPERLVPDDQSLQPSCRRMRPLLTVPVSLSCGAQSK